MVAGYTAIPAIYIYIYIYISLVLSRIVANMKSFKSYHYLCHTMFSRGRSRGSLLSSYELSLFSQKFGTGLFFAFLKK